MTSSRIISGVIFAVLFLSGLFAKSEALIPDFMIFFPPIFMLIGGLWGTWEFSRLGMSNPPKPQLALSLLGAVALLADGYFFQLSHGVMLIGLLSVATIGIGLPLRNTDVAAVAGKSVIAPIYAALPLALIAQIWQYNIGRDPKFPDVGSHYLLFLIIVTWCGDIGAYFAGRAFGKHKLAPTLSPGKTIEGFLGGVALTVVVACLIKLTWNNIDAIFTWTDVILLALAFSVIGPIGDLAESQLKRAAGKKDSGNTFTGHGGMLDIIDSLLFTTIIYYSYLSIVYPKVVAK